VAGLVDAVVDAAAQVLDEDAEHPAVQRREVEIAVDGEGGLEHQRRAF
jgi:hypothetical protein